MGASPAQRELTEDIESSGFLRRQAITRGSSLLGPYVKNAGLAGAVYFSQPVPLPRTSTLMSRDTTNKPQQYKQEYRGLKDTKPAQGKNLGLGQENWKGNYERSHTANRTRGRSSKTKPRSSSMARASGGLYAFGKLLPTIGFYVAVDDLLSSGQESATYTESTRLVDRNRSMIGNAATFSKDAVFNPTSSPAAFVTHAALLALFS